MLVSVIIPTFNREETIIRALDSVIKQQCVNFDVWVIDDGSTDSTSILVKNYILENFLEQKVHYVFCENSGVSMARNLGIELSSGEWIAFLDSDDEWLPEKLRVQVDSTVDCDCPLIHTNEIWIRRGVRVNQMKKHSKSGGDIFMRSLKLCLISPSTVMIRRELLESVGYFDPIMTVCEDYDLWLRITAEHEICYIDQPLIKKYGGHEDQLSRKFPAMDYWRVLAIEKVLQGASLSEEKKQGAIAVLLKKSKILLKGFLKHHNMDNYDEVLSLYEQYSGKKFLC